MRFVRTQGCLSLTLLFSLDCLVRAESAVSRTQVDVLRKDKRNLEQQMADNVADETLNRRLAKQLDYVKSCLNKAEEEYEAQELSARTTQVVSERVFDGTLARQNSNKPLARVASGATKRDIRRANAILAGK